MAYTLRERRVYSATTDPRLYIDITVSKQLYLFVLRVCAEFMLLELTVNISCSAHQSTDATIT